MKELCNEIITLLTGNKKARSEYKNDPEFRSYINIRLGLILQSFFFYTERMGMGAAFKELLREEFKPPCKTCDTGWGDMSENGSETCHDKPENCAYYAKKKQHPLIDLIENQQDMPPEFNKVVDKMFREA